MADELKFLQTNKLIKKNELIKHLSTILLAGIQYAEYDLNPEMIQSLGLFFFSPSYFFPSAGLMINM